MEAGRDDCGVGGCEVVGDSPERRRLASRRLSALSDACGGPMPERAARAAPREESSDDEAEMPRFESRSETEVDDWRSSSVPMSESPISFRCM